MHCKSFLVPAALALAAAPVHGAPFCAMAPEGFHFQNHKGSLKLLCLDTGESVMTLALPGHTLAVCADRTDRVKLVVQGSGQRAGEIHAFDLGQGTEALQPRWAAVIQGFLDSVDKAHTGSREAFTRMMNGIVIALDAESAATGDFPRGDERRAGMFMDHWNGHGETLGMGHLEDLLTFMRVYRAARSLPPEAFPAPRLGGLLQGTEVKLTPPRREADGSPAQSLRRLVRHLDSRFDPGAADADPLPSPPRDAVEERQTPADGAGESKLPLTQTPARLRPLTLEDLGTPPDGKAAATVAQAPATPMGLGLRYEDLLNTPELADYEQKLARTLVQEIRTWVVLAGSQEADGGDGSILDLQPAPRTSTAGKAPAEEKKGS